MKPQIAILLSAVLSACATAGPGGAGGTGMSYFITSAGPGNGASLGGLAGADEHCRRLAEAAGTLGRTWRAYLSTQAAGGQPAVNARDRIGNGPWHNARGVRVAASVADLHADSNGLTKQTSLDERGQVGAQVGHHDRTGGGSDPTSWNSAHESRGCGQEDLRGTGGDALFYCFGI
jgi:hypothetical protein